MRTQIQTIFMALLLFLGLSGCVKDDGNYDYHDIPVFAGDGYQVKVNGESVKMLTGNKIVLKANDSLTIIVNGKFTENVQDAYEWGVCFKKPTMNPDNTFDPARIIATGKDFKQRFTEAPGNYLLYFKASVTSNNTAFYDQFEIEVETIKGLFVLHTDNAHEGDYSAIRTVEMNLDLPEEKMGVVNNIYSAVNNGAKIANPTALWMRLYGDYRKILVASTTTITMINYETHVMETDKYHSFFLIAPEKAPLPQGHMNGDNRAEYLVQNGELCKIDHMSGMLVPRFSGNIGRPGIEYAPSMMYVPAFMDTDQGIYQEGRNIAFNKTNRSFDYDGGWTGISSFISAPGSSLDISNTQMNLIYMDRGNGGTIDAVMQDDDDRYHYVRFNITDPYAANCTCDVNLSAYPQITAASHWAVAAAGEAAFFSAQNEVYILNHRSKQVTAAGLNLPTGAEITTIKVLKDADNSLYDNGVIFIGYNLNGAGTVRQYRFNPLDGRIDLSSEKEFTGFGEIIDIELKK